MSICSIFSTVRLNRPFVSSKVHEVTVNWLYDSGASITCLNTKVFRKIPIEKRPPKLPVKFKATCASGSNLKIRGYYLLPIKILGRLIYHPVVVCDNLRLDGLIGADLMRKHHLNYNAASNTVYFSKPKEPPKLKLKKETYIPARSRVIVQAVSEIDGLQVCNINVPGAISIVGEEILLEGPNSNVCLTNCGQLPLRLPAYTPIASVESVQQSDLMPWQDNSASSVERTTGMKAELPPAKPVPPLTMERRNRIREAAKLDHLSKEDADKYLKLLFKYHDVISISEFELGACVVGEHRIPLNCEKTAIFQPQFPLALEHIKEIQRQVKEWTKLGIVSRCESEFNSPLFVVKKKTPEGQPQKWRIVQDFRKINQQTLPSNLRLPLISECLDKIGKQRAEVFTSLDLRSGFYQIPLAEKDKKKTAFWVQDFGQFCWERAPQGLSFMPFSFQRIMERIFRQEIEQNTVIAYLDDLLCYAGSTGSMIEQLEKILQKLRRSGLLINVEKCEIAKPKLTYLGFEISAKGYAPDPRKVKDILACPVPTTIKQVRAFIGMLQFYRSHFPKFSQDIKPLSKLTGNKSGWSGGQLPLEAKQSFENFKKRLANRPILHYPDMNLKMHLYVDASLGEVDDENTGGLAACLVQYQDDDATSRPRVLGYVSRTLQKHEKNYSAFLAENLAAVFGIESFSKYLTARRFVLHTDHLPMTKLNNNQKRTLARLKDMVAQFSFDIEYIPGKLQPADYMSRYGQREQKEQIANIECPGLLGTGSLFQRKEQLINEQHADPLCLSLFTFLKNRRLPSSGLYRALVKRFGPKCLIEDGLLKITLDRPGRPTVNVVVLPACFAAPIIAESHCSSYGGHSGAFKTIERILENFWLPGLAGLVNEFIAECAICCKNAKKEKTYKTFLKPIEPVFEPFVRLSIDLYGPLQSPTGKKYILVMIDSFSKLVEFAAIKDKTPESVAEALFSNWFNRYGMPVQILHDSGTEFRNSLLNSIYETCGIERKLSSVQHPETNGQCELVMKKVTKYLKSMIDTNVLDWEPHLDAMRFSWNTAVSTATKMSPYAILFGLNPRTPMNNFLFSNKSFYGEDVQAEHYERLQLARKLAAENNLKFREEYKLKFDATVQPESFPEGTLVFLHSPELNKLNPKLKSPYVGPFVVQTVLNSHNCIVQNVKTKKTKLVNVNRLRAFKDVTKADKASASAEESGPSNIVESTNSGKIQDTNTQNDNDSSDTRNFLLAEPEADIIWLSTSTPPLPKQTIKSENIEETEHSSPQDLGSDTSMKHGKKKSPLKKLFNKNPSKETPIDLSPAAIGESFIGRVSRSTAKNQNIVIPDHPLPTIPLESLRTRPMPKSSVIDHSITE